jgi:hypothetical protein
MAWYPDYQHGPTSMDSAMTDHDTPRIGTTRYDDQLANGDPLIAVIFHHNESSNTPTPTRTVEMLGTGFEGWEAAFREVKHTVKTGTRGWEIPESVAESFEGADTVHLFTVSATVKMPEDKE